MLLSELMQSCEPMPTATSDVEIDHVTEDSRTARPGSLFFALAGARANGTEFAADAVARGAVAVVATVERPDDAPPVPWLVVVKPRHTLARAAAAIHGHPARSLAMTAVTGSKGKTTTSFLLAAVSEAAGERSALLTTVLCRTGAVEHHASLTTASAPTLHRHLREAVEASCTGAVVEVSSHAIDQQRVRGLGFETGVFTNLFSDHLDYHRSLEHYFETKQRLFRHDRPEDDEPVQTAVIGIDDCYGQRLAAGRPDAITFGLSSSADVHPTAVTADAGGLRVTVHGLARPLELSSPLLGRHNVPNLLAAVGFAHARGYSLEDAARGIAALAAVPGRLEPVVSGQPFACLVDYAHTGPALTAVLRSAREWTGRRLLVVFGAGGDRDPARRTEMGKAAAELADMSFLTTDNPRREDPKAILSAIERAYRAAGDAEPTVIADRAEAIAHALACAKPGDTVIVAGKGHEREQIIGDRRRPFDDRQVAREALAALGFAA